MPAGGCWMVQGRCGVDPWLPCSLLDLFLLWALCEVHTPGAAAVRGRRGQPAPHPHRPTGSPLEAWSQAPPTLPQFPEPRAIHVCVEVEELGCRLNLAV